MICPQCKPERMMHTFETDHLTIHACPCCGGYWFSESQLQTLSEVVDPDLQWLDLDFWKSRAQLHVTPQPWACPDCRRSHLVRVHDEETDTTADTCPQCRGIWLEAGQLDRILKVLSSEVERMDSADYVKESLRVLSDLLASRQKEPVEDWKELKTLLRLLKYRLYSEHPKLISLLVGAQKSLPL